MNTRITLKVLEATVEDLNRVTAKTAGTDIISYAVKAENGHYYISKMIDNDFRGHILAGTKTELNKQVCAMKQALYMVSDAIYMQAKKESK